MKTNEVYNILENHKNLSKILKYIENYNDPACENCIEKLIEENASPFLKLCENYEAP